MTPEEKLNALGLEIPSVAPPAGSYVPVVRTGNLIFTAGQLPLREGKLIASGKVPTDVPQDVGEAAAMQAVLNALAAVKQAAGEAGLAAVRRVVRMNVFVNSAPGFTAQAKVANAASDLLLALFGDAGRHTRCAVGAAELPLNATVELDLVVEVG